MSSTSIDDFEGSPSVKCPFCGEVSWVGSMDGACEHLFATGDSFDGTAAWSQIDDAMDDDDRRVVEDFLERSTRNQDVVIVKLGGEAGKTLGTLRDSPIWWNDFIENEAVTADIDEPSFSTTYYSVFVANPEKAIEELKLRYLEAVSALRELWLIAGPGGKTPRHGRRSPKT